METHLEKQLVLGEPLDRFEEVGGEREAVAEVSLTAHHQRVVVPHLGDGSAGCLHVLTVSENNLTCRN